MLIANAVPVALMKKAKVLVVLIDLTDAAFHLVAKNLNSKLI
jgi:hypothetical protein